MPEWKCMIPPHELSVLCSITYLTTCVLRFQDLYLWPTITVISSRGLG
jgi:hypothetical protein